MLFLRKLSSLTTLPDSRATCAAIRSLIAYADGLEGSRIDVTAIEGAIVLSGVASSNGARERALWIAGEYAGVRIVNNIALRADQEPSGQSEIGV